MIDDSKKRKIIVVIEMIFFLGMHAKSCNDSETFGVSPFWVYRAIILADYGSGLLFRPNT